MRGHPCAAQGKLVLSRVPEGAATDVFLEDIRSLSRYKEKRKKNAFTEKEHVTQLLLISSP